MRPYIVKWSDLEMARNGKPGFGIGWELEGSGLGTAPQWWPLESKLARHWVRWTRLQPSLLYLTIDTLDAENSNGHDVTHICKPYGQPTRKLWYDCREACTR